MAMGLAMAVTAVIARRIGEGKQEEAAVTGVQAISSRCWCRCRLPRSASSTRASCWR
ncbi:MAG: hypothetical protein LKM39_01330 [Chiayiivirga sp.]|nr:hypothetical protein [Chiayiivirga sp.]